MVETPAYKALNPNSKVPTIEDGDFVLWESNSIMRYLCMKYGGEALYPVDPATRADIDRWLDWSLSILVPVESPLFLGTVRTPPEHLDRLVVDLRREVGAAGELKGMKISSQDVTKQYTDLESRLRGARAMEQRLLQMIKDGKGEIKQLLEAEKELLALQAAGVAGQPPVLADDPVTADDDGEWVVPDRLADHPCQGLVTEPLRELAVGGGFAER